MHPPNNQATTLRETLRRYLDATYIFILTIMKQLKLFFAMALLLAGTIVQAAPFNTDGWLHYDNGRCTAYDCGTTTWGVDFPASSINGRLTKVSVYLCDKTRYLGDVIMTVYNDEDWTEAYSQRITPLATEGWQDVVVVTPVRFTRGANAWITLSATPYEEGRCVAPMSYADDPTGNWAMKEGGWQEEETHHAFMIRAYFDPFIPADAIWSEDFEDSPETWTTSGITHWEWGVGDTEETTGPNSGNHNMKRSHVYRNTRDTLFSPILSLDHCADVVLHFWYINRQLTGDVDILTVAYRTTPNGTFTNLWNSGDGVSHDAWTLAESIHLNDLSETFQLAFIYKDNYGYGIGLDDIYITGRIMDAPCIIPTDLHIVGNPTHNSATLAWTAGSEDQQKWLVWYAMAGYDPMLVEAEKCQITLTELWPETDYEIQVLAVCDEENDYTSNWSEPVYFKTPSEAEAVENIAGEANNGSRKLLRNGQLLILRGDRTYNATGIQLK